MKINLTKTRKGYPAMWESGGAMMNSANATIVGGFNFNKLTPVFIKDVGSNACASHALFIVEEGYKIGLGESGADGEFHLTIWVIDRITKEHNGEFTASLTQIYNSLVDGDYIDSEFDPMASALKKKLMMFHCSEPIYLLTK